MTWLAASLLECAVDVGVNSSHQCNMQRRSRLKQCPVFKEPVQSRGLKCLLLWNDAIRACLSSQSLMQTVLPFASQRSWGQQLSTPWCRRSHPSTSQPCPLMIRTSPGCVMVHRIALQHPWPRA